MPVLKGRAAEDRRRAEVEKKMRLVLRAAARAGAAVIADEAKLRVPSRAVREGVQIGRATDRDDKIAVRITVKEGWARSLGTWLEWGTEGHFITVDQAASGGRTARRVNYLDAQARKDGREGLATTLVINGKPVGATVWHPGTNPEPWLRTARDTKGQEAMMAAQAVIKARVRRTGIIIPAEEE